MDRSPPTRPTGVVRAVDPVGGPFAAATAVFAAVAAEGGSSSVLGRVAQEAARHAGGQAAVVRFDADTRCTVVAWPTASHRAWDSEIPPHWSQFADTTRRRPQVDGQNAAAAIVVDGRFWGALVARGPGAASGHVLEQLAGLVALAVSDGAATAAAPSVDTSLDVDALTAVASHRAFRTRLEDDYRRAVETNSDLSLVLFDIDGFKDINQTHGHGVGDEVLARFAERLVGSARRGDLVARTGGGAFAWILPGVDAARAWEAAERFRKGIAENPISPVVGLTASAGICTATQASDLDELVRFAEGALYWAKNHGRNASYVFTPEVVRDLSEAERSQRMSRDHAMRSIRVLARAVDAKDHSTREHSERVADLAVQIAIALGWSIERTAELRDAGLLHDVGKIGIPDAVLLKPGSLTDAEYELVKSHPVLGARIAADVLNEVQQTWVRGHHERFDGRGYPDGLAGEDIPEGARILALADSWDVMTSVRSYREAWSMDEALLDCRAESGRQFWPEAVSALELLHDAGALLQQAPPAAPTAARPARPARTTEVA